jgi:outer membrane protein assembly factor BamA
VLKDIKKSRIEDRLLKVSKIAGLKNLESGHDKEKLSKLINQDFDEKDFDKNMDELFNEDYFDEEDEDEEELKNYIKDIENEFDD